MQPATARSTFWVRDCAIRCTAFSSAADVGRRKTFGAMPMKIAIATTGAITAHSRGDRSGSFWFFSFVTSP